MATRYTPTVHRPDLCAKAQAELNISHARAYHLEGRWMVQGWSGSGEWRLFLPTSEGWAEITTGGDYEQGRLL